MSNRILRDWTHSDKVDSLTPLAERFFTRLIMKVDDFGCFYSKASLVKASLFPLQLDSIREADITRWMAECQKAGLIVLYEVSQKQYLEIIDFNQRLRTKKRKFPSRINDGHTAVNCPPEGETEVETETEVDIEVEPTAAEGHNVFLQRFFSPVSDYDREQVCVSIHEKQILESWGAEFNAHLHTSGKWHHTYRQWTSHFANWLSQRLPVIKKQDSGQGKSKIEQALNVNQQAKEIIKNGFGIKNQ
jgi:hypothetical protein